MINRIIQNELHQASVNKYLHDRLEDIEALIVHLVAEAAPSDADVDAAVERIRARLEGRRREAGE